jgi:hypothetical protein
MIVSMRALRTAVICAALGVVAVSFVSCLDPTEITLAVSTDVRCEDTKGTSFTGGAMGTIEGTQPNTTTSACTGGGEIGTLVATPNDSKDTGASFLIAMGVDRPVNECTPQNHYKGCVVQRRSIRYVKHKPINLPVKMWLVCKDVECDKDSTCARNGKCVPANIVDAEACASGDCYPTGDSPDVPPAEAGAETGPGKGDGGPITDGGPLKDADADAPFVVPPPPEAGTLFCPPVMAGCSSGNACCWSRAGLGGRCDMPCLAPEIMLSCDRKSDCTLGDYCCGFVADSIGNGVLASYRPPSQNFADSGISPDGGPGTRTLQSASCGPLGGGLCSTVICTTNADCPPAMPTCNLGSMLFTPMGVLGECQ